MRTLAVAAILAARSYPPPFPREGAAKVIFHDQDAVVIEIE
jgi:hypothetical protein